MTTLPKAIDIRVNKANEMFAVVIANLPDESFNHVFNYGLRQILNDACASSKSESEAREAVASRLERLMSGTLRASSGRTSDPIAREAKSIATAKVDAAIRAKGRKPSDVANRAELISKLALDPKVLAKAKANVEATSDLDLDIAI